MTDPRLGYLIQAHLDGLLSVEEQRELDRRLCDSESARQQFWNEASLHGALHEVLKTAASAAGQSHCSSAARNPATRPQRSGIRHWSTRTAAVFGLLVALLSASLVYACMVPRMFATSERLFELIDGSFEESIGALPMGLPRQFREWSADDAEIVTHSDAKDGKQVLCFVRAAGDPGVANSRANSCDVFQWVDLRNIPRATGDSETKLELSARFLNAADEAKPSVKFSCRLYVFAGDPEALRAQWPLSRMEAIAMGSSEWNSLPGSPHWHEVTATVLLPQQADFAVVQLVVGKPSDGRDGPAEFGEQFVDDVRLMLRKQPTLPMRAVQH